MTVKEASKTVEGYLPDCDTRKFVLDILARAEKKKPLKIFNLCEGAVKCGFCDNCNQQVVEGMNFCSACGQALDWSNADE